MDRDKLIVSFSGGRTSAFMAKKINEKLRHKYEPIFVFANTGKEREETLQFINQCDVAFGLNVVWVEAVTNMEYRKGVTAKVVNFETASRNGEPFEQAIAKHGLPNQNRPICTRELKAYAIKAYARQIGWKKYYTAIGIRADEMDRMNPSKDKERLIYPLISIWPTRKVDINEFWINQPFDLNIKSYQGNCDACWKKSFRKLYTIARETPEAFDWWAEMEKKYENFTPASRMNNPNIKPPHRFFRNNMTAAEIVEASKAPFELARDDSRDVGLPSLFKDYDFDTSNGCEDSCEPF